MQYDDDFNLRDETGKIVVDKDGNVPIQPKKKSKAGKFFAFALTAFFVVAFLAGFIFLDLFTLMYVWNAVMPGLFGVTTLSWKTAFGVSLVKGVLFAGTTFSHNRIVGKIEAVGESNVLGAGTYADLASKGDLKAIGAYALGYLIALLLTKIFLV